MMFVLDTNILRKPSLVAGLRAAHPQAGFGAPAVVVYELVDQALSGRESLRGALLPVARGDVSVLPEPAEAFATAFGRPAPSPSTHERGAWQRLARLVAVDRLAKPILRNEWRLLHTRGDVSFAPWSRRFDGAAEDFAREAHRMVEESTGRLRSDELFRPLGDLEQDQPEYARRLVAFYAMITTGLVRAWLFNQLAALAGVPGAERAREPGEVVLDDHQRFERCVKPAYRGGLEVLVAVAEARWAGWLASCGPWPGAQRKGPESNDLADLLLLASVDERSNDVVVTNDTAWVDAAKRAGWGHRVLTPEAAMGALPEPSPRVRYSVPPDATLIDWRAVSRDPRVRHHPDGYLREGILQRALAQARQAPGPSDGEDVRAGGAPGREDDARRFVTEVGSFAAALFRLLPVVASSRTFVTTPPPHAYDVERLPLAMSVSIPHVPSLHVEGDAVAYAFTFEDPAATEHPPLLRVVIVGEALGAPPRPVPGDYCVFIARADASGDPEAHLRALEGQMAQGTGDGVPHLAPDTEVAAILLSAAPGRALTGARVGTRRHGSWTWTPPERPPHAAHAPPTGPQPAEVPVLISDQGMP